MDNTATTTTCAFTTTTKTFSASRLQKKCSLSEIGGVIGTRPSKTLLAQSDEFARQFSHLLVDRSSGRLAGDPIDPPEVFDGREVWKKLLPPVRDQGACGSCWAFAATDCLSARLSIATYGKYKLLMSPAAMVVCNLGGEYEYQESMRRVNEGLPYDYVLPSRLLKQKDEERSAVETLGCQGETLIGAWQYLYRFGAIEEVCVPYEGASGTAAPNVSAGVDNLPACSDMIGSGYDTCPVSGKPSKRHRAGGYYHVPGTAPVATTTTTQSDFDENQYYEENEDEEGKEDDENNGNAIVYSGTERDIRREIYHWGPVTTGFIVYPDFETWASSSSSAGDTKNGGGAGGVYQHVKSDKDEEEGSGHAVVIVGWGALPVPYWLVKNSWGPAWGDRGYFRIRRGTNECQIEENVIVGFPNLYGYRLYIEWPLMFREHDLALRAVWTIAPSGHKMTILEKMLDGRLPPYAADVDAEQYRSDWWPNLATFVAGKPWKTEFLLQRGLFGSLTKPRNSADARELFRLGAGVVVGVIAGAAVIYVLFVAGKRKDVVRRDY